ncbi:hypothetical protein Tco_0510779 [Tanacetum coccineum]
MRLWGGREGVCRGPGCGWGHGTVTSGMVGARMAPGGSSVGGLTGLRDVHRGGSERGAHGRGSGGGSGQAGGSVEVRVGWGGVGGKGVGVVLRVVLKRVGREFVCGYCSVEVGGRSEGGEEVRGVFGRRVRMGWVACGVVVGSVGRRG